MVKEYYIGTFKFIIVQIKYEGIETIYVKSSNFIIDTGSGGTILN